jgi:hypothetical protein
LSSGSRRHTTHDPDWRELKYRWHPWRGRSFLVLSEYRRDGVQSVVCTADGDERRRGSRLPAWMFDERLCSAMCLVSNPYVSWSALEDLRELLDGAKRAQIEPGHVNPSGRGDAHGKSAQEAPCGEAAATAVRRTVRSAKVEDAVGTGTKRRRRVAGRDTSSATRPAPRSRKAGRR